MNPIPTLKALLAAGATAALLGSCSYDPYYTDASYSHGYYGYGHGYGGSTFSTSVLIGTGDPRWGYDPYTYAYYDYTRRAYYDPYLYGYYPVGYRPPILVGVPHPHGWRHGRVMPPPTRIRTVTLQNYRERERAYRQLGQPWGRSVRPGDYGPSRGDRRGDYGSSWGDRRDGRDFRSPGGNTPPPRWSPDRGANRRPDVISNQPSWNRRGSAPNNPVTRDDNRNPWVREREDARRGNVPPAPAARPGTAWQDQTGRAGRGGNRDGRGSLPESYNRPITVQPEPRVQPQRQPQRQPQTSHPRVRGRQVDAGALQEAIEERSSGRRGR